MLPKADKKERNELFWAGFKEVMRQRMSSSGKRINWINYPTQVKNTYIRLICDEKLTAVCYDIQFKDPAIKTLFWEQLGELKKVMEAKMKYPTQWTERFFTEEGLEISRISWELEGSNFYKDEDWKAIYQFFKSRLSKFDEFYQEFKDILITLVD